MKQTRITVGPRSNDWVVRHGRQALGQHASKAQAVRSGLSRAHAVAHSQRIIKKANG